MYFKHSLLFFLTLLSFAIYSCGGDADTTEEDNEDGIEVTFEDENGDKQTVNVNIDTDDIQNGIADALQDASDAIRNSETDEDVEAMDFRDLKDILPERLLGMDRTDHSGERTSAMGFTLSQAEAEYEEDDQRLDVQVVDAGQAGMMKLGMVAWASVSIDRESDDGYERTSTIDGHKAYEKWDSGTGNAELIFFYDERYIITLKGDGLEGDDLRKALNRIDYDDLD
ncbi:MAG: hypothetical protein AAFZ63_02445 [Bacteroidota bacterium]